METAELVRWPGLETRHAPARWVRRPTYGGLMRQAASAGHQTFLSPESAIPRYHLSRAFGKWSLFEAGSD